jgi:cyclic pyranopterin phosphate synthase
MITGVDGFEEVYSGIIEAEKSGAFPCVKVNMVVMRGMNDKEIPLMAEWALGRRIDIRFIEFMPTHKSGWGTDLFVGEEEIRSKIGIELDEARNPVESSGPARTFRFRDYPGRISFISAVSRGFCNHCNRLRLTASGRLIGCLFREKYLDLKDLLNRGRNSGFLKERIYRTVVSREFRRIPGNISIDRFKPSMRRIGG